MNKYLLLTIVALFLISSGCSKQDIVDKSYGTAQASEEHSDGHDHAAEAVDSHGHSHAESDGETKEVTRWTDKMEMFMEYPQMTVSTSGKFTIHLTYLENNRPVNTGEVELVFRHEEGAVEKYKSSQLIRDGIFAPTIHAHRFGNFDLDIIYRDGNFIETFEIKDFVIYLNKKSMPHEHEEKSENITFLKEQQWRIPFKTSVAEVKGIRNSIEASGSIKANPENTIYISAPVRGRVAGNGAGFPVLGQSVEHGHALISLISIPGSDNWATWKAEYDVAKLEFTQAQRLIQKDAISKREFEQIRLRYESLQNMMDNVGETETAARLDLFSPLEGHILQVMVKPGDIVNEGDPLVQVVNNSSVHLEVNLFNSDIKKLSNIDALGIHLLDNKSVFVFEKGDFDQVSPYPVINPRTNSGRLSFRLNNPDNLLSIGQNIPVDLLMNVDKNSVVIPRSALYEEEGIDVVFVQVEGDEFERRFVRTGAKNGGYLEVLAGINAGERVVVDGGYQVKLASTTSTLSHGHAH